MKIEEIYIEAFGCLENTRIKLEPGLNIITKDNEQGKTTAAEFIRAMLYGINSGARSVKSNPRKKYMPFGKSELGGELVVEHGGVRYLIARRFGMKKADDTVNVLNAFSGERLAAFCTDSPCEAITGVSGGAFEKALYFTSFHIDMSSGKDEITDRLVALGQSGDEEFSYKRACEILNKAINELSSPRSGKIKAETDRAESLDIKLAQSLEGVKRRKEIESMLESKKGINAFYIIAAVCAAGAVCCFKLLPLAAVLAVIAAVFAIAGAGKDKSEKLNAIKLKAILDGTDITPPEKIKAEIACCKQKAEKYRAKAQKLADAKKFLDAAFNEISQGYGAKLNTAACEILSVISGGKYDGVKIDKNFEMTVRSGGGWYSAQYLSDGAYDQIYFSLKCAVIKLLFPDMTVIADDAFVRYDKKREKRALEYLSNSDNQVILFSCR